MSTDELKPENINNINTQQTDGGQPSQPHSPTPETTPEQVDKPATEKPKRNKPATGKKEKKEKPKKIKRMPLDKIQRYNQPHTKGLTSAQAELRHTQGYSNIIKDKNAKTVGSILAKNIFTFFNMLSFVVAGALIYVGAGIGNIFFILIVIANMTIGIIQEIKAKNTIEKIKLVTSPTAQIMRDGKLVEQTVNDIVLDDILFFETGKQISADCIIVDGEVEVNESLLTGESISIKKKKGDTILSGSFIVGGRCYARADAVGDDTYSAQLAAKAKQYSKPKSELLRSLRLVIRVIGIIIIPLAVLMFINNAKLSASIPETIQRTAGSIIGMIPAGMFLLTSMALAVGVIKLAGKRTLVQDLYSIEMLARTDILCLDKTGTITDGTMKVNEVISLDDTNRKKVGEIVGSMLTALDDNNQTSRALVGYFGYSKEYVSSATIPFSSSRKLSAVTFKNGETYILGAPEFVVKTRNKTVDDQIKQHTKKAFGW